MACRSQACTPKSTVGWSSSGGMDNPALIFIELKQGFLGRQKVFLRRQDGSGIFQLQVHRIVNEIECEPAIAPGWPSNTILSQQPFDKMMQVLFL